MHDEALCTEMIRRILPDFDIGHIEFTQSQRTSQPGIDTRGVRFDVYAKSDNRKIFDCEVQTSDKKDLPRRTRAYHIANGIEILTKDTLKRSGSYNEMPDVFVIFICTFDPFHSGRHKYTFYNTCYEDNSIRLDDGGVTVFLNAKGTTDDVSPELKAFLDFIMGKSSDDPFIMELDELLRDAKKDARYWRDFMLLLTREDELRAEVRAEAREEARAETEIAVAEARNEEKAKAEIAVVEARNEEKAKAEVAVVEARNEEREKTTRLFIDRLINKGISYNEAIEMLGLL